jgi:tRNA nucleotidyltransferase/poly(A) polymerase
MATQSNPELHEQHSVIKSIPFVEPDFMSPLYLVGGSIRDVLLGRKPKDYDYATPLLPDDIEAKVRAAGKRPYVTGKRFGTIGFNHEGQFVEVTTFRSEQYGKTRKPEVQFVTSITEDLSRRDFTINAIAQRGTKTVDPFGGYDDLQAKVIRAVGNPSERFNEDPLRMLRAVRFVSQLGFTIEPTTHKAIVKNAHKILSVSRERWIQELDKLLVGDHVVNGLYALYTTDLIKFVLPELRIQSGYDQNSDWHELSLVEHTIRTVAATPTDLTLRWAALLHDIAKPFVRTDNKRGTSNYVFHDVVGAELVYGIGKRLKWSNERLQAVQELVKSHLSDDSPLRAADNGSKAKIEVPT